MSGVPGFGGQIFVRWAGLLGCVGLIGAVWSGWMARALAGWMAAPDAAVLMLVAGLLLVYLEFNVPGTVVPGAVGALLVMLAVFELSRMRLRWDGAVLGGVGLVLLGLRWMRGWAWLGVAVLVLGLTRLVEGGVGIWAAAAAGGSFGGATLWLGRIALRARDNKRVGQGERLREVW